MKKEYRFISTELRASGDGNTLSGYAAVYNVPSNAGGLCSFTEVIAKGAFDRSLAAGADIVCLTEHNVENLLGRTASGTLRVSSDDKGLKFECDLPSTTVGNNVRELLKRGDLKECSFGFFVADGGQTWSTLPDGTDLRTLTDLDVFDVSVVAFPFYSQTSASLRSAMFPEGEVTAPVAETPAPETRENENGCECECEQCLADNCAMCSNPDCDDAECRCDQRHIDKLMAAICAAKARL